MLVFLAYNFILTVLAPFWLIWMLFRAFQRKEKPDWKERRGIYPFEHRQDRKRIWIHAVSVGEVVATIPLLREVKALLPEYEIVLSVTTSSGHTTAREQAAGLYEHLVYFPIEVPRFMLSAMQKVQPAVVVTIDTELWLDFVWAAKSFRATTMVANGRISDRSFPRMKFFSALYRTLLGDVDLCLTQTQVDADRLAALGAKNVQVLGNMKFDQALDGLSADPEDWKEKLHLPKWRPVIVIGSSRGEEEEIFILEALKRVGFERLSVVHAPRHLERVSELSNLVKNATGHVALRSRDEEGAYLILDTYGELSQVYSVADFVIVGGGFADLGGQNIIQPLAHGKPVIHGPHMENFRDVTSMAASVGATRTVQTPQELANTIEELIQNPDTVEKMGQAAKELVMQNVGASKRYAIEIAKAANTSEAVVKA
ncbi:MAG TPA: 3-deoxy-D-manno-octulosonic acid transferase [Fimbriimonadaceae bacterium]|jgi:3-deoxy-D-manno-octulosonic-acid transferase